MGRSGNNQGTRVRVGPCVGLRRVGAPSGRASAVRRRTRRGVAAVLAMMFLILFGSLSVAMAIASQGNLTTAATHVHVSRAHAAAETGLAVARARLREASARFVVSNSDVDEFGADLWTGSMTNVGTYQVLPPATGRLDMSAPSGLSGALAQAHSLDQNIVTEAGVDVPTIGNIPAGASSAEFATTYWLFTPAVSLEARADGSTIPPLSYSITYAPLANGRDVRVIVTGYDWAYSRGGQPITRTISEDFRMVKRVNHAIISPSRVMIGSNVMVTGDLGARFTGVTHNHGDPVVLRSDFVGKNPTLDSKLSQFWASVASSDVDGDNRLRVGHPIEGANFPANQDFDGDGQPDNAFDDVTGDGYVDEFDIFIKHYDRNGDGRVTLSAALTAGTPAAGMTPEFTDDDDLALLIDSANPDRNKNGISGFIDANGNGRWDAGEVFLDYDPVTNSNRDQVLGYRDGFIDRKDQYAKVTGRLTFRTTKNAWEVGQGASVTTRIRGPIIPGNDKGAQSYGAGDDVLPDLSAAIFDSSRNDLIAAADGQSFARQVAQQLGINENQLATYIESRPDTTTLPRFLRLDPDANGDGLPDNYATAYFEKMPYNSPNHSDWYYRPVYQNMVFKDVVIPVGTNALFRNCTFVGVTYVRSTIGNSHVMWGEYGKMTMPTGQTRPMPTPTRYVYGDSGSETSFPAMLPSSAIPPNAYVLMATQPMDKADIPANQVAYTQGYNLLPDPLIISGARVTDTKLYSNNLRFHDCLFVGSIVADAPGNFTHSRNKIQFTGATRFAKKHPEQPDNTALNPEPADLPEISKSSMMLPNYSVDIGTFNSPQSQNVELQGAIIAGVLDARGNTTIDGALLLTFSPAAGQGPLRDSLGNPLGNPAGFNSTLGYFGPEDGDSESLDPASLPIVNGQRIAGWDTNGDGLFDVPGNRPQPSGSTPVPFNGLGRIHLRFNPDMNLPNGIMLPMQFDTIPASYREGRSW